MDKEKITVINCINDKCPIPLVKTREAIMDSKKGDVLEIIGTHKPSFEEIIMALEALDINIIYSDNSLQEWKIKLKI